LSRTVRPSRTVRALEHEADVARAVGAERGRPEEPERRASQDHLSFVRTEEPRRDGEERRLSRSAGPLEEDDLARVDDQRDAAERTHGLRSLAAALGDPPDVERGHGRNASTGSIRRSRNSGADDARTPIAPNTTSAPTTSLTRVDSSTVGRSASLDKMRL